MITFNDVSFGYRHGPLILQNIRATLKAGRVYGLLGLNGVGKTTLLRLLAGGLFCRQGQIRVLGFDPGGRSEALLSRLYNVAAEVSLPDCSIAQYMALYRPFYPNFEVSIFYKALEVMHLERGMLLHRISFGQRKKVVLCFALATQCELLLLDEPTDGLDSLSKAQFRRLLSEYIREDRTVLIATHHIQDVTALIDHLLVLERSHILLDAPVQDIAQQYSMISAPHLPDNRAEALYSERTPGGYRYLSINRSGTPGLMDLEFFFKAVSSRPDLTQIFHNQDIVL
jgi:ABC-2 type transport system ATP-binding protein